MKLATIVKGNRETLLGMKDNQFFVPVFVPIDQVDTFLNQPGAFFFSRKIDRPERERLIWVTPLDEDFKPIKQWWDLSDEEFENMSNEELDEHLKRTTPIIRQREELAKSRQATAKP